MDAAIPSLDTPPRDVADDPAPDGVALVRGLLIGGALSLLFWLPLAAALADGPTDVPMPDEVPALSVDLIANPYDRDLYDHWIDEDGDCLDTRAELLVERSLLPDAVLFNDSGCTVRSGLWHDWYSGKVYVFASAIDVDHVVPLAEAHRSGAWGWDEDRRRAFANDPFNLLLVDDGLNQEKSDRGPEDWLPPNEGAVCLYISRWVAVKQRYRLSFDERETAALQRLGSKHDCLVDDR